jgi:RNA polymerase subunit RPABC4/transcription elongation factor Spt4
MPDLSEFLTSLITIVQILVAVFSGFFMAFTIALTVWTFRDIRSRSRDIFAQILAALLVLLFNLPGLLLYYLMRPKETLAETYERALGEEALLQDIEEKQACPGCKQAIQPDYMVCPNCHTKLRKPCVHCGRLMHLKWSLCPYCGTAQTPPVSLSPAAEDESDLDDTQ